MVLRRVVQLPTRELVPIPGRGVVLFCLQQILVDIALELWLSLAVGRLIIVIKMILGACGRLEEVLDRPNVFGVVLRCIFQPKCEGPLVPRCPTNAVLDIVRVAQC